MPKISEKLLFTFRRGLACSNGGLSSPSPPLAPPLITAFNITYGRQYELERPMGVEVTSKIDSVKHSIYNLSELLGGSAFMYPLLLGLFVLPLHFPFSFSTTWRSFGDAF